MRRFGKGRKNFGYVSRFNCKPLLFNVFHSNFLIFVYETSVLMVTSKTFRDAPRINMYHEYTAFFHLPIFFFLFLALYPVWITFVESKMFSRCVYMKNVFAEYLSVSCFRCFLCTYYALPNPFQFPRNPFIRNYLRNLAKFSMDQINFKLTFMQNSA